MGAIADLFGRLRLDDSGFEADVKKSAEKASDTATKTMGQRVSAGFGRALKGGFVIAAGASAAIFGAAARGANQLRDATLSYQSATGATEEAAKIAQGSMSRLFKTNRTDFATLSGILVALKQNMGLTGDAAEKAAQQVLDFAKVTKQDGVAVVGEFDDILDAFNLTADDQGPIMDKLVVSQQKYGGSVADSAKNLAAMAPALQAANLGIDDGIGLLNLFASTGLDASLAPGALTKALTKVHSPAELKRLIADIQNTPDDFQRAQKAAELFGSKAGAKLANALKPTTDQVAKQARALAATAPGFKKYGISLASGSRYAKQFLAAGFSVQQSVRLTAAALKKKISPESLRLLIVQLQKAKTPAAALKLATKALGDVAGKDLVKSLGLARKNLAKGSDVLGDFEVDTKDAAGATKTASDIIEESWGNRISLAMQKAGGFLADFGTQLGPAFSGIASVASLVGPAALKLGGGLAKGLLGGLTGIGTKILSGLGVELASKAGADAVGAVAGKAIGAGITKGVAGQAVGGKIADSIAAGGAAPMKSAGSKLGGALKGGMLLIAAAAVFEVYQAISDGLDKQTTALTAQTKTFVQGATIEGLQQARAGVAQQMDQIPTIGPWDIFGGKARVQTQLDEIDAELARRGAGQPGALAGGITAGGTAPVSAAMAALKAAELAELDRSKELVKLRGELHGKALADALASKVPAVRAAAEAARAAIQNRIRAINGQVAGEKVATDLAKGIAAKQAAATAAARALAKAAGIAMVDALYYIAAQANPHGGIPTHAIGGYAPPGQLAMFGEKGPEIGVPRVGYDVIPANETAKLLGGQWGQGGGDTFNITVPVDGLLRAESPADVVRPLRQLAQTGYLRRPASLTTSRA